MIRSTQKFGLDTIEAATPIFTMNKEGVQQKYTKTSKAMHLVAEGNFKDNKKHGFAKSYNTHTGKINSISMTNKMTGQDKDYTFELRLIQLGDFFKETGKYILGMETRTRQELNRDQAKKVSKIALKHDVRKAAKGLKLV